MRTIIQRLYRRFLEFFYRATGNDEEARSIPLPPETMPSPPRLHSISTQEPETVGQAMRFAQLAAQLHTQKEDEVDSLDASIELMSRGIASAVSRHSPLTPPFTSPPLSPSRSPRESLSPHKHPTPPLP